MSIKKHLLVAVSLLISTFSFSQQESYNLTFTISVDNQLKENFKPEGRLLIYLTAKEGVEPRNSSIYNNNGVIFGKNIADWNVDQSISFEGDENWTTTADWDFQSVPKGTYYIQSVWNQNGYSESRINTPQNLYSKTLKVDVTEDKEINISLSEVIPDRKIENHELAEEFSFESELLSKWWDKPMPIKTAVLLPSGYYKNPDKNYPIRYNVAGYGGRYTRINRLLNNQEFMSWWESETAPQVITVFLDGEGPFGDNYHLNSKNSGPYGEMLTLELIPQLEQKYRTTASLNERFVDGCSTGGWVSLALQLFYPDTFDACWSYSPDPVTFSKMQLINVYEDENAFYNQRQYLRPSMRNVYGEPQFSIKEEITYENVEGSSNTYTTSGGQWGAWNALYSPKGQDGLPMPIFDPNDGTINKEVAEHWKTYDLLLHVQDNWTELGSKLEGKLYIWNGDMDNFYLNNAMRDFDAFLKTTTNPTSDAVIEFSPMKRHCEDYSHKRVLEQIQKRLQVTSELTD